MCCCSAGTPQTGQLTKSRTLFSPSRMLRMVRSVYWLGPCFPAERRNACHVMEHGRRKANRKPPLCGLNPIHKEEVHDLITSYLSSLPHLLPHWLSALRCWVLEGHLQTVAGKEGAHKAKKTKLLNIVFCLFGF